MDKGETLKILKGYEDELGAILGRFNRTHDGLHIGEGDDPRFRQIVHELIDFLDDTLGNKSPSREISSHFNEGIANFFGSPSYKSIENIRGIVLSVITRIERNPEILSLAQKAHAEKPNENQARLMYPEKVTLIWLVKHVPVRLWIAAVALLIAIFLAGIQVSRIPVVKEIFGLYTKTINQGLPTSYK